MTRLYLEQLGDEEESMADLGVQTSPGLDSSSSLTSPALTPSPLPSDRGKGGGGSSGGFRSGGGGRFASSTPSSAPSVKNTASFLASTPTTSHQLNQVWPPTQFFSVSFWLKIIDLPGGQINDPSSEKHYSLPFLPATPSSPSRTHEGLF